MTERTLIRRVLKTRALLRRHRGMFDDKEYEWGRSILESLQDALQNVPVAWTTVDDLSSRAAGFAMECGLEENCARADALLQDNMALQRAAGDHLVDEWLAESTQVLRRARQRHPDNHLLTDLQERIVQINRLIRDPQANSGTRHRAASNLFDEMHCHFDALTAMMGDTDANRLYDCISNVHTYASLHSHNPK